MCRPSRTATLAPSLAASSATVRPASRAPTTQISTSRSNESRKRSRIAEASGPLVALVGDSLISFSYGPIWPLSPCTRVPNPKLAQPCRALFSELRIRRDTGNLQFQCGFGSEVLLTDRHAKVKRTSEPPTPVGRLYINSADLRRIEIAPCAV